MKNKYLIPTVVIICFIFLVSLTLAVWWDTTYAYKRPFTNYNGTTFNFTIINHMNTDFSDIRFIDSGTESIEYPYWLESPVNNKSSVIHLGTNSSFYIYYGNSTKTSNSNINLVYPGIKHYYPFDEGTGTEAKDGLGTSNFTLSNVWVNGRSFSAYSVSGSEHPDSNFKLGDIDSSTNTFSVTFWLFRTGDMGATGKCISNGGTSGIAAAGQWEVYCNSDQIGSYINDGSLHDTLGSTITINTWYFVVYTYNGSIGKLTANGVQVGNLQPSTTFDPDSTTNTLWFFGRNNGVNLANSYMDDVRFYNHTLNSTEIAFLGQINSANYTLGAEQLQEEAPQVVFSNQNPTDLTTSNVFGHNATFDYNITDPDATPVNASTARLFFKTNSSTSDISFFVNGSSMIGFFNTTSTNVSSNFSFQVEDNEIYPATYNYNELLVEDTPHSVFTLGGASDIIITRFFNVSNNKPFGIYEMNASCTTNSNIYYCNSSYTTGSPAVSSFCTVFATINSTTPVNHTHSQYSQHKIFPFSMNTTTGLLGTVYVTPVSYFLLRGSGGTCNQGYITNVSRVDTVRTSVNTGATYTNLVGTTDTHLHQFDGSDTFYYYACANDTANVGNCSTVRFDIFNLSGMPPTAPFVFSPTNSTYYGTIPINYTQSSSPTNDQLIYYNISLVTPSETFVSTIQGNNSLNLSYNWDSTTSSPGSYRVKVEICSNNTLCNAGFSDIFTIQNITNNGATYSANAYTTDFNSYMLNLSSDGLQTVTATLNYNGVNYPTIKSGDNVHMTFNSSFDIPSTTSGSVPFYWTISYGSTNYTTQVYTQNVIPVIFGLCTTGNNMTFVKFEFQDESTSLPTNATISSAFIYYLGSGTQTASLLYQDINVNPSYSFCMNPPFKTLHSSINVQYNNPSSATRTYAPVGFQTLTNVSTNNTLLLLPTSQALFVTFQILAPSLQPVPDASMVIRFATNNTIVESKSTDAAGTATFLLNPNTNYNITVSKAGFNTVSLLLTPSQTQYTITLGQELLTNLTIRTIGVTYSTTPISNYVLNNTMYNFTLNMTSGFYVLSSWGFVMTYNNASGINTLGVVTSNLSAGGVLSLNVTIPSLDKTNITSNYNSVFMNVFWTTENGTIVEQRVFTINDLTEIDWSVYNFFRDLRSYLTTGFFGLDNFGLNLIIFIIMFVSMGIVTFKYGLQTANIGVWVCFSITCIAWYFGYVSILIPTSLLVIGISILIKEVSGY